jgi:hypothetical protein
MSFAPRGQRVSDGPLADSESYPQSMSPRLSRSEIQFTITLFRAAGMTSAQTGEALGMSAVAVRVAAHRARAKRRAERETRSK